MMAPPCMPPSGETGRVSGILAGERRPRHQARVGRGRRHGRARQARHRQDRRHARDRQDRARGAGRRSRRLPPVLAISIAAADRKDDVKLGQALLRLNEEDPSLTDGAQPADPRHRAVGAGRDASARGAGAAARSFRRQRQIASRRRSAIRRPSANRSPSAAGTRSSPAATASSATWCWRSGRCRAAKASGSRKRWSAARCRAIISARWRRAWSTG